jgi:hypothetical protein
MSPMPVEMRDRWACRAEPTVGHGTVYWHVLMSRYPGARAAAGAAQDVLRNFDGLHLTPMEWLHMTLLAAGSTEDIERGLLDDLLRNAENALWNVGTLDVTLRRVLYHPEAIMLAVEPRRRPSQCAGPCPRRHEFRDPLVIRASCQAMDPARYGRL